MKKVLITGGAGFIGSHTADLLMEQDIPVRVLDNLSSGHRHNLPDKHPLLEFIEGDICDEGTVKNAMNGVSHCLNLAAQVSVVASLEDPAFSARQNILGFVNVLEAARTNNVQRLVYASSAAIYGEPPRLPLDEDLPVKQLSPYGLEKQINEQYCDLYHRLYNFSSLGMRYFNVYGPRQDPKSPYAGVIALLVDRISASQPVTVFGDGKHTRDFIFVRDVARTNVAALQSNYQGACNVATGQQTTLLDLIDVLSDLAGNQTDISFEEPRTGDIVHSLANPGRMNKELGVVAESTLKEGLSALLDSVNQ
ncbi:MAG: NAD-dependent epimerase/dehydratase family protein [Gammaproteobacteria bacterium]|nr:NAD-dependent epimerase/dehydratase family protein [Gammaproteobacteria bacterium]